MEHWDPIWVKDAPESRKRMRRLSRQRGVTASEPGVRLKQSPSAFHWIEQERMDFRTYASNSSLHCGLNGCKLAAVVFGVFGAETEDLCHV